MLEFEKHLTAERFVEETLFRQFGFVIVCWKRLPWPNFDFLSSRKSQLGLLKPADRSVNHGGGTCFGLEDNCVNFL